MQKAQIVLLNGLCVLLGVLLVQEARAQNPIKIQKVFYAAPLDGTLEMSAPFGELRNNHFHSGVDYRIGGKVGAPVYSVLAGYVSRIVVRPDGFGKALYINHPNGKTSVYGHLDGFAEPIAAYVRAKQYERKRFSQDIALSPNELPMSKKQLIGYGGNSGSSRGPHLHFELRAQHTEHPQNFFAENIFRPRDTIAPTLSEIIVYQMDTLMGLPISWMVQPLSAKGKVRKGTTRVRDNDTIVVPQTCFLGVIASDRINGSQQNNPVYLMRVTQNGMPYFEWIRDAFNFSRSRYANAVADYVAVAQDSRTIMRTYKHRSWNIDFVKVSKMEGAIRLSPNQVRKIIIRLEDESGNRTDFSCFLKGDTKVNKYTLPASVEKNPAWFAIPMGQAKEFKRKFFEVIFSPNTLYEGAIVKAELLEVKNSPIAEAIEITALDIPGSFSGTPWHTGVKLRIPTKEIPTKFVGKATWAYAKIAKVGSSPVFVGAIRTSAQNAYLECSVTSPGCYGIVLDTVPPFIVFKNVVTNENVRRKSVVIIDVKDDFSGVQAVEAFWNDKWVLADYSSQDRQLRISIKNELVGLEASGVLRVQAVDAVGNESSNSIPLKL